jgi:phage FluMu protein Com
MTELSTSERSCLRDLVSETESRRRRNELRRKAPHYIRKLKHTGAIPRKTDIVDGVALLECRACHDMLPEADFYRYTNGRIHTECPKCQKIRCDNYRASNREAINKRRQERRDSARGGPRATPYSPIEVRVLSSLRSRLSKVIRNHKAVKQGHTQELLGCMAHWFVLYIESLWTPGMTWNNYGRWSNSGPNTWHIDHIRPCASFDLASAEEQRRCFHWTNLQPLWAETNMQKRCSPFEPDYQI